MNTHDREIKTWVKYLTSAIIGLVIALVVSLVQGLFKLTDLAQIYLVLSNAFFIPGCVLVCFGLLTWVNKEGTFDIISYGLKSMRRIRRNFRDSDDIPKTYYDYKEKVKRKRNAAWHMSLVGIVYIVVGILFDYLFNTVV